MRSITANKRGIRGSSSQGIGTPAIYFVLFTVFILISLMRGGLLHSSTVDREAISGAAELSQHIRSGSTAEPAGSAVTGKNKDRGTEIYSLLTGDLRLNEDDFHFLLLLTMIVIATTIISLRRQISRKNSDLRMSEEKFRLIFEHSPLGIFHFDSEGVITACNSSFEVITGIKRNELNGFDMMSLADARILNTLRHVLKGNISTFDDIYISGISEKSAPIRAIFAPLSGTNGDITGGMGIVEDITIARLNEEKLVTAREAAEKANMAKSIFLANMSHEVRTPLNGILGILQILRKSFRESTHHEYIEMAMRSGERLTRLLSDILDLTKIESGHFSLVKERVDIRGVISSVQEYFSGNCSEKGIELTYKVSDRVPELITGDELRLRQILQNLTDNSVKFTSAGSISIGADFISAGGYTGTLILEVTDTGIGIEKERIRDILEPFRQVENTYTRRFQGAGLGLAIVQRLVNLMDGKIEIESTPRGGTAVKCTMKVETCKENPGKGAEISGAGSACIKPLSILLVEDDRINSLMARRLLEKMDHAVTDAANGIEALQCIERADFDIVLMDIQMPEMNGIEAIKEIRRVERFGSKSGVCVIALTAYAMAGDREKFLEAGFDEYLPKPLDTEELNSAILRLNPLKES